MMPRHWVLACLLASCTSARAQWQLREASPPGLSGVPRYAVVASAGARLEVYRDAEGEIRGRFTLSSRFARLADRACPTLRVGQHRALALSRYARPCLVQGDHAELTLGKIKGGRLVSAVLVQLMDGNSASLSYRTSRLGYGQEQFDLRDSRQVLTAVVGPGVQVVDR